MKSEIDLNPCNLDFKKEKQTLVLFHYRRKVIQASLLLNWRNKKSTKEQISHKL